MPADDPFRQLRKVIDELAAADAAELVAEARVEARAKVRAILADELAAAMLKRSRVEIGAADLAVEPEPADAPPPADLGWYVYGVVAAPGPVLPDELPGVDPRHAPLIVVEDDLAAVASQVPLAEFGDDSLRESLDDHRWLAEHARVHDRVLDEVAALTTIVPMRMCTIYRSESALRRMLVRERAPIADGLERFTGKAEWDVKVFARWAVIAELAAQHGTDPRAVADGFAAAVHERLGPLAGEVVVEPVDYAGTSGHRSLVFDGAYLVPKSAVPDLRAALAALRAEYEPLGLDIVAGGPAPPSNFVNGSIETAW